MSGRVPADDRLVHAALEVPGGEVVDGVVAETGDLVVERVLHVVVERHAPSLRPAARRGGLWMSADAAGRRCGEGGGVDPRRLLPALTAAGLRVRRGDPGRHARPASGADRPPASPRRHGRATSRHRRRAGAGPGGLGRASGRRLGRGRRRGAAQASTSTARAPARPTYGCCDDYRRPRAHGRGAAHPGAGACDVVGAVAATAGRCVVTDRVVGGGRSGHGDRVALPVDRASTRRVVLVRDGRGVGGWSEVRDQASAAASTSRTSSSSKS